MTHINIEPLRNRIRKNLKLLKPWIQRENVSCYRVYDWDMPEFPWCIDYYEGRIHAAEYATRHPLSDEDYQYWLTACKEVFIDLFQLTEEQLYLKLRERKKQGQYEKVNDKKEFFTVKENGLLFQVNLQDYLDTGLFLDHRPLRKQVMQESKDKHVLNLFAYTGSFSVYAAAGGAFTTTTVDLSNTYLNWAKENFKLNQLPLARHSLIKADVKEWLKQPSHRPFDIIVLDPPTVSKSKMTKTNFDVQTDHVAMIQDVMRHLSRDGVLYFSTNYRDFILDETLFQTFEVNNITLQTIPNDFRNKKIHYCWSIRHQP
ncbi:MAG: class I SAM-dependent methyltransferase [Chitinophagaceae bacterium]|nr:class I SAM-dependent methyltransferase [Chitinophagaceae bacterium]